MRAAGFPASRAPRRDRCLHRSLLPVSMPAVRVVAHPATSPLRRVGEAANAPLRHEFLQFLQASIRWPFFVACRPDGHSAHRVQLAPRNCRPMKHAGDRQPANVLKIWPVKWGPEKREETQIGRQGTAQRQCGMCLRKVISLSIQFLHEYSFISTIAYSAGRDQVLVFSVRNTLAGTL